MNQENKDSEPHIEPSEPHKDEPQSEESAGDPGRTPGKAEGEDDEG